MICGDVQAYAQEIEEAAETSGIPCFIDYKSDLMNDPLVDLLRSIFRVFETDFRADAVTHYMKNVLSGYSFEVSVRGCVPHGKLSDRERDPRCVRL